MTAPAERDERAAFAGSRERFETILGWLEGDEAPALEHGEVECRLEVQGRELLRQLFQDHLDLPAQRETRLEGVVDAGGCHGAPSRPTMSGHWAPCSGR